MHLGIARTSLRRVRGCESIERAEGERKREREEKEEEEERGLFIAVLMWIKLLWRPGK